MSGELKKCLRDLSGSLLRFSRLTRPGSPGKKFYIVTFHRVLTKDQLPDYPMKGLAVTEEEFEWFLVFFKKWFDPKNLGEGYSDFCNGAVGRKPALAITFDDGQLDNYLCAFPLLEKHSLKATFFIPFEGIENQTPLWHDRMAYAVQTLGRERKGIDLLAELGLDYDMARESPSAGVGKAKCMTPGLRLAWLNRAEKMTLCRYPQWDGLMNWDQVDHLVRAGHEIGSHTITHSLLLQCSDYELDRELSGSKKLITRKIHHVVNSFCYPNGDHDARVRDSVMRAGYKYAVTTAWGINGKKDSPFELKRLDMTSEHSKNRKGQMSENRVLMRMAGYRKDRRK